MISNTYLTAIACMSFSACFTGNPIEAVETDPVKYRSVEDLDLQEKTDKGDLHFTPKFPGQQADSGNSYDSSHNSAENIGTDSSNNNDSSDPQDSSTNQPEQNSSDTPIADTGNSNTEPPINGCVAIPEKCDGLDNDCDGFIDEEDSRHCSADDDCDESLNCCNSISVCREVQLVSATPTADAQIDIIVTEPLWLTQTQVQDVVNGIDMLASQLQASGIDWKLILLTRQNFADWHLGNSLLAASYSSRFKIADMWGSMRDPLKQLNYFLGQPYGHLLTPSAPKEVLIISNSTSSIPVDEFLPTFLTRISANSTADISMTAQFSGFYNTSNQSIDELVTQSNGGDADFANLNQVSDYTLISQKILNTMIEIPIDFEYQPGSIRLGTDFLGDFFPFEDFYIDENCGCIKFEEQPPAGNMALIYERVP